MAVPSTTDLKVFVPARNFDQSTRFYTMLGWALNWKRDGLAEIELAGTRLYLQDFYAQEWAENFMIYVDVADAAAWHQHAREVLRAGPFPSARAEPPKREDYGALVTYVWDPCGVLLHFAESTP